MPEWLIVVYSWCRVIYGEKPAAKGCGGVSHGICDECAEKFWWA